MPAIAALLVVLGVALRGRARHGGETVNWPWLVAEVEARAAGSRSLSEVTFGLCLHGPPPLAAAARSALSGHGPRAPASVLLEALRVRLASPHADRLCATVTAVELTGVAPGPPLARLRAALAHAADADGVRSTAMTFGLAGRWLLLAPLLPLATGVAEGLRAWVVAMLVVGLWCTATRMLRHHAGNRAVAGWPLPARSTA